MTKHRNPAIWMLFVILAVAVPTGLLMAIFSWNNRPPNIKIPTHSVPKDNGWDYFVRAAEMIAKTHHYGPMSDPTQHKWTLAEYESFMRDNAAALAVLREGLEKECVEPPARSEVTWFPSFAGLREAARTLGSEAQYYDLIGKPGKAMDSRLDCVEFGVMMPRGGMLISGLVGLAIESIGSGGLEDSVKKVGPGGLERAALRLERLQAKRVSFSEIILEDGYATAASLSEMFKDPAAAGSPKHWFSRDPLSGDFDVWNNVRFSFCNKTAAIRENLAYCEAVARESKGYYTGTSKVPAPRNAVEARWGGLDLMRARSSFESKHARVTILQMEVALLRFRADHDRYPQRLRELVPRYVKSRPIDPFGQGRPLCYKLLGKDKFLLYSRGFDLKDDGGKAIPLWDRDDKGDFVAGHLDMQRP